MTWIYNKKTGKFDYLEILFTLWLTGSWGLLKSPAGFIMGWLDMFLGRCKENNPFCVQGGFYGKPDNFWDGKLAAHSGGNFCQFKNLFCGVAGTIKQEWACFLRFNTTHDYVWHYCPPEAAGNTVEACTNYANTLADFMGYGYGHMNTPYKKDKHHFIKMLQGIAYYERWFGFDQKPPPILPYQFIEFCWYVRGMGVGKSFYDYALTGCSAYLIYECFRKD